MPHRRIDGKILARNSLALFGRFAANHWILDRRRLFQFQADEGPLLVSAFAIVDRNFAISP